MKVENGPYCLGGTHSTLPWLWEEEYVHNTAISLIYPSEIRVTTRILRFLGSGNPNLLNLHLWRLDPEARGVDPRWSKLKIQHISLSGRPWRLAKCTSPPPEVFFWGEKPCPTFFQVLKLACPRVAGKMVEGGFFKDMEYIWGRQPKDIGQQLWALLGKSTFVDLVTWENYKEFFFHLNPWVFGEKLPWS